MRRLLLGACLAAVSLLAQKQPFTVERLLELQRLSEHELSPDGTQVAFTVQTVNVEANTKPRQIWVVPLAGGTPRKLTTEGNNYRPRWSADGKSLAFLSTRSGSAQVWLMNADGSGARQVTTISTEADAVSFVPGGSKIVFTSEVYPECTNDACNKAKLEAESKSKLKARTYTSLLYRHWDTWQGARRKHIFLASLEGGEPKDLTPGTRDVPPFSLGGGDDYAIAPDGNEICFVMNTDAELATSTNSDLFVVSLTEPGEPRKVVENPAADNSPLYSPDGRYIAYRAQSRPGFESDRWRLMLLERETGRSTSRTDNLDLNVEAISWAPDSKRLFFVLEDRGRANIHMLPIAGGASRSVVAGASHMDGPQFTPDGRTMIYAEHSGSAPTEIFKASSAGGAPVPLTRLNDALLRNAALQRLEDFWVDSTDRARVHSFVIKPPDFDKEKKYPVLFLIHGGPQGAWGESWSYRWNPQVFASAGFVVVMPNPRGSTGYGQKFTDEVSGDWGGRVYDDIMAVTDHVAAQPWADPARFAAAGGSFGGYMVNWLLGHTDRFKAFVSHAGVYDLPSMGGETEELWFTKWEFGGLPWQTPETHAKWSPSQHSANFKTPTLVIHGELDFRVPYGQGLQLFTALKMNQVPSKLLVYPDEGHWILKPQNTVLWYKTFQDWIQEWTRPQAR
ncbi:MAG: S9 family peptidase [Acidobacteria bacterium]|nr:S9 family peptidase [Acidobacteriota bacterium]